MKPVSSRFSGFDDDTTSEAESTYTREDEFKTPTEEKGQMDTLYPESPSSANPRTLSLSQLTQKSSMPSFGF
jgi:hypothetical protein